MKPNVAESFLACAMLLAAPPGFGAIACRAGVINTVPGAATNFVKTNFTPRCSANTDLHYLDGGTDFAVQAASSKGRTIFGATSAGGGVIVCSTVSSGPVGALAPTSATNPC